MKKIGYTIMIFSIFLILAGCSNNSNNKEKDTLSKSTKTLKINKKKSRNNEFKSKWDSKKNKKLETYMEGFSKIMKQDYSEYKSDEDFIFLNRNIPSYIKKTKKVISENKTKKIILALNKSTLKTDSINVVSMYKSDNFKYLYIFVVENEKPQVLVNENNETNDEGLMQFKKTENEKLMNAFNSIYNGQPVTKLEEKDTTTIVSSSNDDKQSTNSEKKSEKYVPKNMLGHWYMCDPELGNFSNLYFTENSYSITGDGPFELHSSSEKSSEEKQLQDGTLTIEDIPEQLVSEHSNWTECTSIQDGIHLRGWYQNTSGDNYIIHNVTIDGENVVQLEYNNGYQIIGYYYRTEEQAQKFKDKTF